MCRLQQRGPISLAGMQAASSVRPTYQIGELPQDLACEVRQERVEVERNVPRPRDQHQPIPLLELLPFSELLLAGVETKHLGCECGGQVLERVLEARDGGQGLCILGGVENANDPVDPSVELEFGEEGERV